MNGGLFSEDAEIVGCTLGNRYLVNEVIGKGGFAIVYKGTDNNLGVDVAIKVPRQEIRRRRGFQQRFEEEKRRLTQVRGHNSIVSVTDAGMYEDIPYLVMDFMPGRSLRTILNREGRQTEDDVSTWLRPIAEALDAIHALGVVHMDVKPGNILYDREGQAMLSDFGVARVIELPDMRDGSVGLPGSPNYMPPEAERGEVTRKYDQYSLGVVVYQALTAQRPARPQEGGPAVMPPDDLVTGLSPGCSDAVVRALSLEPEKRFPTCRAFAEAVQGGALASTGAVEEPLPPVFTPSPTGAESLVGDPDSKAWGAQLSGAGASVSEPLPRPYVTPDGAVHGVSDGDDTQLLTGTPKAAKAGISKTTWAAVASFTVTALIVIAGLMLKKQDGAADDRASPPAASLPALPSPDSVPGPAEPDPVDLDPIEPVIEPDPGWDLVDGSRTVRLTSPSEQGASVFGTRVLFEGTCEGSMPSDILYVGNVRVIVDRATGEFSREIDFKTAGSKEIKVTIERGGDIVFEKIVRLEIH